MKESNKSDITTFTGSLILHITPFLLGRMLSEGNLDTLSASAFLGGSAILYGIGRLIGRKKFNPAYNAEGTRALAEGGNTAVNLTSILMKIASLTAMGIGSDTFL